MEPIFEGFDPTWMPPKASPATTTPKPSPRAQRGERLRPFVLAACSLVPSVSLVEGVATDVAVHIHTPATSGLSGISNVPLSSPKEEVWSPLGDPSLEATWEAAKRFLEESGDDPDEVLTAAARAVSYFQEHPFQSPGGPIEVPDDEV